MLRFFTIFLFLALSVGVWGHEGPRAKPKHSPYYFVENKGQWNSDVLFKAELPQGNVLIRKEGIMYQLVGEVAEAVSTQLSAAQGAHLPPHASSGAKLKGQNIHVSLSKGTLAGVIERKRPTSASFQYLKGNDASKWTEGAKAYQLLVFKNVYKGIDLSLYFSNGLLKYDFAVRAHANPAEISLVYKGADSLSLQDNHLVIHTGIGKVFEKPPYSYQVEGSKRKEVPCGFALQGNKVSFRLKKYDSSKSLVIDPELIFSTYSGSFADNWGNTATYDDAGNMYSGGIVFGNGALPIAPGPFELYKGGDTDVLILKYTPDGSNLIFAAYLGGSDLETPISMIVNKQGNLVVMGITSSFDFPTTKNIIDSTFGGGSTFDAFVDITAIPFGFSSASEPFLNGSDIFVTVLNTTANSLVASTYLGGPENDGFVPSRSPNVQNYGDQLRGEVMVDKDDNIYIASHTFSDSISGFVPLGGNAHQGGLDAVAFKLAPDLSKINWLHFLGGSDNDCGFGIRVDSSQQVYITGGTISNNMFGGNASGVKKTNSGNVDGYIAKISSDGKTVLASTFLGTGAYDQCYFIDLDFRFNVYVVGQTKGSYPVSAGVYSNPNSGQFLHSFGPNLDQTLFSTVFGSGAGSPDISLTAFMVNDCRKIFVSGWGGDVNDPVEVIPIIDRASGNMFGFNYDTHYLGGNTLNMPVTDDALQSKSNGSGFYFIVLHPEAKSLAYATHYGGMDGNNKEHVDGGTSRFDKKGVIYQSVCAGCGSLSNFPITPNAWSTTNNSNNCNNAALKIDLDKVIASFETFDSLKAIPSIYGCTPITFLLKNTSSGATNYKWLIGTKEFVVNDSLYIHFTTRGKYDLTLIAFDTTICRQVDTARAVINAGDVRVDFPRDRINCGVQPFTADVRLYTPWAKVKWEPTTGVSNPTIANPVITPTSDMQYVITIQDDTLCIKSDTFNIKVRNTSPLAKFEVLDSLKLAEKYTFCYPSTGYFRSLSSGYDSLWWNENPGLGVFYIGVDSFHYAFPNLGRTNYKLSVLDTACKKVSEDEKVVIISYPFVNFPSDQKICPDSSATVSVSGDPSNKYLWSPSHLFADPTAASQVLSKDTSGRIYIYVTDSIGCKVEGSFLYGLYGLLDPIAESETKVCPKKVPGINIQSLELKEYNWVPGDSKSNTVYVTTEGKQYLFGKTLDGCPVRDSVLVVHRCDPEIHVPDAFTPDGDGRNDFFQVFGHEITTFDIKIFNRWGEIIYHSTDFRFQWDGTYRNQTVPIGTYPYVITYGGTTFEGDRIRKSLSGDITVVK